MLIVLVALEGVLVYAAVAPDTPYPGSGRHPEHSEMHVSGRAAEYDADLAVPGAIAGVLMISVFVLALLLGAGHNGAHTEFVLLVAVCSCLLIGSFLMMMMACEDYIQSPSPRLAGGLPVPSAWMIFGVWVTPVSFLAVYIAGFQRWVMTSDDRNKLQTLIADRSRKISFDTPGK